MLISKQESNFDLFFTRGRHSNLDKYSLSQSFFHLLKDQIRNFSIIFILFKQTLKYILFLFHDIAGLNLKLQEWNCLSCKAWEKDYEYIELNRIAKRGWG